MEQRKTKCMWCNKSYIEKVRIARKGILKGQRIVSGGCCSSHSKLMHKFVVFAAGLQDMQEEFQRLKKMRTQARKLQIS